MEAIFTMLVGFCLGAGSAWFITKYKFQLEKGVPPEQLEKNYILRELYNKLEIDCDNFRNSVSENGKHILELNKQLSSKGQYVDNLQEKLDNQKKELESLQEKLLTEFENIANRVLKNRSEEFAENNKNSLGVILEPLKSKIDDFKVNIDSKYTEELKERVSLKTEIKNLLDLNKQVSEDANKLADALKGEVKTQGNWGEVKLEMILEKIGLAK